MVTQLDFFKLDFEKEELNKVIGLNDLIYSKGWVCYHSVHLSVKLNENSFKNGIEKLPKVF